MTLFERPRNPNPVSALMLAVSSALNAFWILNLIKEASPAFKKLITVHAGIGPLSGLYLYSTLIGIAVLAALPWVVGRKPNTRLAEFAAPVLFASAGLLVLMTFPPVFELLLGKG